MKLKELWSQAVPGWQAAELGIATTNSTEVHTQHGHHDHLRDERQHHRAVTAAGSLCCQCDRLFKPTMTTRSRVTVIQHQLAVIW